MAASDPNPRPESLPPGRASYLSASLLAERLEEEVNRASRDGTPLSCLLVVIDNLEELSREHGGDLQEQTLTYVAEALTRGLRNFDRIGRPSGSELLVVLPGADGPRGEVVARRVLRRLRTIKLETDGTRRPLSVSVGLAAWREDVSGQDLLAQTRAAAAASFGQRDQDLAATEHGDDTTPWIAHTTPFAAGSPPPLGRPGPS
jgi:diguanylate cyclase (GGDEF)-like protein